MARTPITDKPANIDSTKTKHDKTNLELGRNFKRWRWRAVDCRLRLFHLLQMKSTSNSIPFGTADGKPVTLYTLKNAKGAEAKIMNYGGSVQSLTMPDRNGQVRDVVLGYDNGRATSK